MKISEYTKEMMNEHSFIDMAYLYLLEKGKDQGLYDIIDEFKKSVIIKMKKLKHAWFSSIQI